MELLADLLDGDAVALPQPQHDEILRISEREGVEQRLVDPVEGMRGRINREAQHVVELGRPALPFGCRVVCHGACSAGRTNTPRRPLPPQYSDLSFDTNILCTIYLRMAALQLKRIQFHCAQCNSELCRRHRCSAEANEPRPPGSRLSETPPSRCKQEIGHDPQ